VATGISKPTAQFTATPKTRATTNGAVAKSVTFTQLTQAIISPTRISSTAAFKYSMTSSLVSICFISMTNSVLTMLNIKSSLSTGATTSVKQLPTTSAKGVATHTTSDSHAVSSSVGKSSTSAIPTDTAAKSTGTLVGGIGGAIIGIAVLSFFIAFFIVSRLPIFSIFFHLSSYQLASLEKKALAERGGLQYHSFSSFCGSPER
jgi:hypothetical protein